MNDHSNSKDGDQSGDDQGKLIDGAFRQVQQVVQQTVTMTQPGGGGDQVSVPAASSSTATLDAIQRSTGWPR